MIFMQWVLLFRPRLCPEATVDLALSVVSDGGAARCKRKARLTAATAVGQWRLPPAAAAPLDAPPTRGRSQFDSAYDGAASVATKKYALACSECNCECNCECSATRLTHFGACHAAATTVRNLNKLWKNALLCASLALFPQLAFRLSGFGSHTNCCCCPSFFFFMTLISFQFRRPNLCKSYSQWWYFNCVRTVIRTVGVCWFWFSFFGGYMRCSLWFVMHWRELSPEVSIIAYIS